MEEHLKEPLADKVILLVEDEPAGRDLLVRFLQTIGCREVVAVEGGEEALATLRSQTPDLVLLDYRLPGMSGLATLRHIKESHSEIPVIMMTAYSTRDVASQALDGGAVDLVVKPLNLKQLEQKMVHAVVASARTPGRAS